MPQTSVDTMAFAVPGLIADDGLGKDVLSTISEEASASIPPGVMVGQGTLDDGGVLLAATTDGLRGVSCFQQDVAIGSAQADSTGFKPGAMFGCLARGRVDVIVEDAFTPASEVHVRAVAAGAEVKGAFRATADGTDTIDITAFARYTNSGGAGDIGTVDIDMANAALAVAD